MKRRVPTYVCVNRLLVVEIFIIIYGAYTSFVCLETGHLFIALELGREGRGQSVFAGKYAPDSLPMI